MKILRKQFRKVEKLFLLLMLFLESFCGGFKSLRAAKPNQIYQLFAIKKAKKFAEKQVQVFQ